MKLQFKYVFTTFLALVIFSPFVAADTDVLDIVITEYVSQTTAYDQVYGPLGTEPNLLVEATGEEGENRTTGTFSRTGIELQDTEIYGVINISNVEVVGNLTLVSTNVTVNGTENITRFEFVSLPSYLSASDVNMSTNMTNPGSVKNVSIFIPELRANDSVIINYTVIGTGVGEPLNFTEVYSFWRVMTGKTINVTLNVTNNFIDPIQIYDLTLTKRPFPYPNVFGGSSYFNYTNLRGEDAANGAITFPDAYSVLEWNASGGILNQYETRQIIFDSTAPTNLTVNWSDENDWGLWMQMGNVTADFKMNGSVSGLRLTDVVSVPSAVRGAVSKDRVDVSWNWNGTANLTNDAVAPVEYNLTQLTVWATKNTGFDDPGNLSNWINNTNTTASQYGSLLGSGIYANATWFPNIAWDRDQSISNYSVFFNYSYIPIVWMDASFIILDNGTQYFKLNESRSQEDGYLFIEEVYVLLGGYLMKVTKELTPLNDATTSNMYLINVTLENIGTEQTPELVTMFDLVPRDFNPLTFSTNGSRPDRNMTASGVMRATRLSGNWDTFGNSELIRGGTDDGTITSGTYAGYWGYHVDFFPINATSDGDGRFDSDLADKEVGLAYKIVGNNSLARIENAYIVGVDPIRLEGASPSQSVASRLKVTSKTMEYVVVLVSLVVSIGLLSISYVYSRRR